MLDGDGQHHPEEIPSLIAPILKGNADLVIGSRFLQEGNKIPFYRKIGQITLDRFTKMASSCEIVDSQSGFRALSSQALDRFTIEPDGYAIESAMISHLSDQGITIVEVPINVKYEVPNKHKKNFLTHGWSVLSNLVGIIGYRRPLISFGIPGMLFVGLGLFLGAWAWTDWTANKVFPYSLTAGGGIFLIIGFLLLNTALILNSLVQIIKYTNKT